MRRDRPALTDLKARLNQWVRAAAVLLLLGVSERAMMGILGWSNPAMTRRYAHMIDAIHHDIATE